MADSRIPDPFEDAKAIARAHGEQYVTGICEICRSPFGRHIPAGGCPRICMDCVGTAGALLDMPTIEKPETLARDQAFRFAAWRVYGGAR